MQTFTRKETDANTHVASKNSEQKHAPRVIKKVLLKKKWVKNVQPDRKLQKFMHICPQQKQTLQTTINATRALASVPGKTQKATRVLASVSVTSEYLHDYLHKRCML